MIPSSCSIMIPFCCILSVNFGKIIILGSGYFCLGPNKILLSGFFVHRNFMRIQYWIGKFQERYW
ncbi:unnamed protein product [Moneuplotes crassus]|uniref:Uncharacterized protein n=1 Tax=Euplotes crassus TaxID=5936 RepID=A0AAD2CY59_EUPCR|nr:unnamed protein product [Moneuplotes crassus]